VTLTPRKLLVAATAAAALAGCTSRATPVSTGVTPPVRVLAVPAPVTSVSAPEAPPALEVQPASLWLNPTASPMVDENGRPLCGNVRTKTPQASPSS
jgi:hypothetical protein